MRSRGGAIGPKFKCRPLELPEPPLPLSKFKFRFGLAWLFPEKIKKIVEKNTNTKNIFKVFKQKPTV